MRCGAALWISATVTLYHCSYGINSKSTEVQRNMMSKSDDNTTLELRQEHCCRIFIKVAPRAEKTEVFRKGWNFANRTYFASCIMRKHYFLLWTKETAFFPYFYHGIIFYSAELFDCAVNFKFYLNIFIFLNINTNQISKGQYMN